MTRWGEWVKKSENCASFICVWSLGPQGRRHDELDEALDGVDVALHALRQDDVAQVVGDRVEAAGAGLLFNNVVRFRGINFNI